MESKLNEKGKGKVKGKGNIHPQKEKNKTDQRIKRVEKVYNFYDNGNSNRCCN